MQILVNVPDEVAARAWERGVTPEAYIQTLVEQAERKAPPAQQTRTAEQIDDFFASMFVGSEALPPLPTSGFAREAIYQDRD